MKRYICLSGDSYYPSGWSDFKGSFDTIEDARGAGSWDDWCEVIDTTTEQVVAWFEKGKTIHDQSLS